jgi:hypothetical protein
MPRIARLLKPALAGLACSAVVFAATTAQAGDEPDPRKLKPKYGLFEAGLHAEVGAGVYQVIGQNGWVPGIYPRAALEYHLSQHISIPLVGRFQTSVDKGVPDFAQLSVSAGVNFRLRELEWPVALVFGAGVRFGKFTASKALTDADFQTTPDQGTQDALGFPLAPEGTVKIEWWVASPLAIKVGVTYSPMFMPDQVIHNVEESLAVALVF